MVESVLFIALCFVVLAMLVGLSAAVSAPAPPKDIEGREEPGTDAEAVHDAEETWPPCGPRISKTTPAARRGSRDADNSRSKG